MFRTRFAFVLTRSPLAASLDEHSNFLEFPHHILAECCPDIFV